MKKSCNIITTQILTYKPKAKSQKPKAKSLTNNFKIVSKNYVFTIILGKLN
jgi:hypothetical protein